MMYVRKTTILANSQVLGVYLDESLRRFDTVLPAAGSSNSCIELTLQELETYAETTRWVDVCKPREG